MRHNLEALTPFDFESLTKSIFDRVLGVNLEIYRQGRDSGVDLAHTWQHGELVVQCKHWPRSTVSALVRQFRQIELPKMQLLRPARYLVSTSADLLRGEKETLADLLSPFAHDSRDIWGRSDIEHFLDEHPEVVRAHLRLWLGSSSTLNALLHQAEVIRSTDLASSIERDLPVFVQTSAHGRAESILKRHRFVLLSGPPGIGKTTLAHVLTAQLMLEGFSVVKVARDIREGFDLWLEDEPQVFVYDDFLGRSAHGDHLGKNEDQDLLDFADKVASSRNKYLILTTRGYILGQARAIYERLTTPRLAISECVLELADLDDEARALILYNHIWASDLEPDEKAMFAQEEVYQPIIEHRNYSPRLVSLSLQQPPDFGVARWMLMNMENPGALWEHAVQRQLSPDSRMLLTLFGSLGSTVALSQLRRVWDQVCVPAGDPFGDRFFGAAEQLFGDFWQVSGDAGDPIVESSNPSLDDYLSLLLLSKSELLEHFARNTPLFGHVRGIWRVFDSHRLRAISRPESTVDLGPIRHSLFEAALRLIDSAEHPPASIDLSDYCQRLRFLVSLATSTGESAAAWELCSDVVVRITSGESKIGDDVHLDAVTDLIARLIASPLSTKLPDQLFEVIAAHLLEAEEWEDTSHCADVAHQLAPFLDEVAEALDARLSELVSDELSNWRGSRNGEDTPRLREMMSYADQFEWPEEVFDGYLDVWLFYWGVEDERELELLNSQPDESSDLDLDIQRLMSGLGEAQ